MKINCVFSCKKPLCFISSIVKQMHFSWQTCSEHAFLTRGTERNYLLYENPYQHSCWRKKQDTQNKQTKKQLIQHNNKKHIQNTDALLIAFASIVANVIAAVVFAAAASAAGTAAAITVTHAVPSHVFVADRIGVIQTCTMLCLCLEQFSVCGWLYL